MLMLRRYGWKTFQDLRKSDNNVKYNFPRFDFPTILIIAGLVNQLREWKKHQKILDLVDVAACHFNRLILNNMPKLSPTQRAGTINQKTYCLQSRQRSRTKVGVPAIS